MNGIVFYPAGSSPALGFAARRLAKWGFDVASVPGNAVTHLLLNVPNLDWEGLDGLLSQLPGSVTVIGGKLDRPVLEGYRKIDLLQDETYLAKNAAITADCAVQIARSHLPVALQGCPVLILGWGRIGKCLAQLLHACGAEVTVAARKEKDLAMLRALGYGAEEMGQLGRQLAKYRVIFNTAPHLVLGQEQVAFCRKDCVKIELASQPGIYGENVVQARGLPGKMAPESSGLLIAESILRRLAEQEAGT